MIVDGNLAELARIAAEAARFCRQQTLAEDVESDLNLVLEELFVNSVLHGGCEGVTGAVEFQLAIAPSGVILEYADRGTAFDPTQAAAPDVTAPLADRPISGMGLHLVRQIVRDIEYYRVDGWNRMRMRRPIAPEGT